MHVCEKREVKNLSLSHLLLTWNDEKWTSEYFPYKIHKNTNLLNKINNNKNKHKKKNDFNDNDNKRNHAIHYCSVSFVIYYFYCYGIMCVCECMRMLTMCILSKCHILAGHWHIHAHMNYIGFRYKQKTKNFTQYSYVFLCYLFMLPNNLWWICHKNALEAIN